MDGQGKTAMLQGYLKGPSESVSVADSFVRILQDIRPHIVKANGILSASESSLDHGSNRQKKMAKRGVAYADQLITANAKKRNWVVAEYAAKLLFFFVNGKLYGTATDKVDMTTMAVAYSWDRRGCDAKTHNIIGLSDRSLVDIVSYDICWISEAEACGI